MSTHSKDPNLSAPATQTTAAEPERNVGEAEFERTRARRERVTAASIASVRGLDIYTAAALVFGVLPGLAPFVGAILALGGMTREQLEGLRETALAARFAHTRWFIAARPQVSLAATIARATDVRDMLVDAAIAASHKNLVPRDKLEELGAGRSARDVGHNLTALHDLLRNCWDGLKGHTALEASDLDKAQALAEQLAYLLGLRDGTNTTAAQAADDRLRAAALLVSDWDEVRRAMQYIRYHEGDAETFAPTLYQRSAPKRSDDGADASEGDASDGEGDAGTHPGTAPVAPVAPVAQPAVNTAHPATHPATQPASRDPLAQPGMPNSDPFEPDPSR